ncbi:hypothetical protein Pcinc_019621 [Petrolisthes cinctipes]|uniref:Uncharacterized protein n=1 Tax=Petrolisthes cinctipes TaxID=88211 RepID=A0AAE1FPJ2_PETCI|nr:hypothetical protein Pcinc_019621 [Petrolisthes cinctipes]
MPFPSFTPCDPVQGRRDCHPGWLICLTQLTALGSSVGSNGRGRLWLAFHQEEGVGWVGVRATISYPIFPSLPYPQYLSEFVLPPPIPPPSSFSLPLNIHQPHLFHTGFPSSPHPPPSPSD